MSERNKSIDSYEEGRLAKQSAAAVSPNTTLQDLATMAGMISAKEKQELEAQIEHWKQMYLKEKDDHRATIKKKWTLEKENESNSRIVYTLDKILKGPGNKYLSDTLFFDMGDLQPDDLDTMVNLLQLNEAWSFPKFSIEFPRESRLSSTYLNRLSNYIANNKNLRSLTLTSLAADVDHYGSIAQLALAASKNGVIDLCGIDIWENECKFQKLFPERCRVTPFCKTLELYGITSYFDGPQFSELIEHPEANLEKLQFRYDPDYGNLQTTFHAILKSLERKGPTCSLASLDVGLIADVHHMPSFDHKPIYHLFANFLPKLSSLTTLIFEFEKHFVFDWNLHKKIATRMMMGLADNYSLRVINLDSDYYEPGVDEVYPNFVDFIQKRNVFFPELKFKTNAKQIADIVGKPSVNTGVVVDMLASQDRSFPLDNYELSMINVILRNAPGIFSQRRE